MSPKTKSTLSSMNAEYAVRKRTELAMTSLDLAYQFLQEFDGDGLENLSIEFLSRPGRGEDRKKDVFLSRMVDQLRALREQSSDG